MIICGRSGVEMEKGKSDSTGVGHILTDSPFIPTQFYPESPADYGFMYRIYRTCHPRRKIRKKKHRKGVSRGHSGKLHRHDIVVLLDGHSGVFCPSPSILKTVLPQVDANVILPRINNHFASSRIFSSTG